MYLTLPHLTQVYLESASLTETTDFFTASFTKFLEAEMQFQNLEESAAVSALAKVSDSTHRIISPAKILNVRFFVILKWSIRFLCVTTYCFSVPLLTSFLLIPLPLRHLSHLPFSSLHFFLLTPFSFLTSFCLHHLFCCNRRTKMICPKLCRTWSPTSRSKQELLWWWVYSENWNSFLWGDSRSFVSFAFLIYSTTSFLIISSPLLSSPILPILPFILFFLWCFSHMTGRIVFWTYRFRTYSPDKMPEALRTVLSGLSVLVGPMYGELSLKAKQLIDDSLVSSTTLCIPFLRNCFVYVSFSSLLLSLLPVSCSFLLILHALLLILFQFLCTCLSTINIIITYSLPLSFAFRFHHSRHVSMPWRQQSSLREQISTGQCSLSISTSLSLFNAHLTTSGVPSSHPLFRSLFFAYLTYTMRM